MLTQGGLSPAQNSAEDSKALKRAMSIALLRRLGFSMTYVYMCIVHICAYGALTTL